ncbi:hypothetical protein N658DRAFT_292857 [Parathielavia hyrcaniae]|uniref:F-box domain-containing protein n=1 Tax=Parathielavia hyrcaniae TaxID=113614 RepID=A0AAN6PT84_9PEZI|nr:hypothetical protein N658DRAFT_292857 [Parathielavia hyrcaniae]
MVLITQLPCEIIAEILLNLDHLRFLPPALLACRHFYASYKESHGIAASILRRQIAPGLLPYAVAVLEASRLPRRFTFSTFTNSFRSLLDELYDRPARLADRLPVLPMNLMRKMSRTHDVIHAFAIDFATRALDGISARAEKTGNSASGEVALSPSEYFRFCRALYRVELFYTMFWDGPPAVSINKANWFFFRHPPWENEQIGCIHVYLQTRLVEASRDVVEHDVLFGL